MSQTMSRLDQAKLLGSAAVRLKEIKEAERCEQSLAEFYRCAWPSFDPADFTGNWHLDAIAEHLEAVTTGDIRRIVINVPPRTGKTSLVSICYPAWVWAQRERSVLGGAQISFFYASYAEILSLEHSLKTRRLIESRWYRKHWARRFSLVSDRNTKGHFENDKGGYRMASSVDAKATGFGADILVADDPHLVKQAESDIVRRGVVQWWTETMPSRLNDRRTGAMIIVMQRVHEEDLTGYVLAQELGYEHLMLPMHCDAKRITMPTGERYRTVIGFADPREDGELLWPERLPEKEVKALEKELGPYGAAAQLEQTPEPRGGGVIKRDWWKLWDDEVAQKNGVEAGRYPPFEYVVASLDTAYTEKEENDYSALSIWGLWREQRPSILPAGAPNAAPIWTPGHPNLMLMMCWAERLQLHDLVNKVAGHCQRFKVDRLIIENKAAGHSVSQEIRRLFGTLEFSVELFDPRKYGDKIARGHAVVPIFTDGLVWAPDKEWAQQMIDNCAILGRGAHDDLADTATQALLYMRKVGVVVRHEEQERADEDDLAWRGRPEPIYDV